ncbi:RNA methyltransferase [Myxococcota bacterium]|nr:RNA methyltransferase [Myxococcota bacterium]
MQTLAIRKSDDARIDDYRHIRDKIWLRDRGIFIAESRLVIQTLLQKSTFAVRSLLLTPTALDALKPALQDLPAQCEIFIAEQDILEQIAGFEIHRGALAAGIRPPSRSTNEILPHSDERSLVVLLEAVTNPDNVGSVFRTAKAFGADAILFDERTVDPLYRKSIRTSIASTLTLPFAREESFTTLVKTLQNADYTVLGFTPDKDALFLDAFGKSRAMPKRVAIALGNEGDGLSDEAKEACDELVQIEMSRSLDSLNIASAASIAIYRFRQIS